MDQNIVIMLVSGAAILTASLLLYLILAPRMSARARTRRRVSMIAHTGAGAAGGGGRSARNSKKRDIQSRLKHVQDAKAKKQTVAMRYRKLLRMAGLKITVQQFLLICCGLAVISATGLYFLSTLRCHLPKCPVA